MNFIKLILISLTLSACGGGEYTVTVDTNSSGEVENISVSPTNQNQNTEEIHQIILLSGQSNSHGRADISGATSEELEPQPHIMIWNRNNGVNTFEPLLLGVNNTDSGQAKDVVGMELGFIHSLPKDRVTYLVKYAKGNTDLDFWSVGGNGYNAYMDRFINPVLEYFGDDKIKVNYFFHQGETSTPENHYFNLVEWLIDWREVFPDVPVSLGEIERSDYVNQNFSIIESEYPNINVIQSEGFPTFDGVHFTSDVLRTIGKLYVNLMPQGKVYTASDLLQ